MRAPIAEIAHYLSEVDKLYRAGNATEHSYRPALKSLFEKITTGLTITNEPKHIACGAPDYIITKAGIPLGYIEAKDIPVGIDNKLNKEQFDRYKQSLGNLIITNYLTFQLFVDGELLVSASLANENKGSITPDKKQFPDFLELINQFTKYSGKTIYNSEQLAKMMAEKSKLLAAIIKTALRKKADDDTLSGQYAGFKKILIHNLEVSEFADIYAQTLAYGLFAARLNQRDDSRFTRYLAPHLIPQSNPFLRKFFNYVAGINLDSRIAWIVDALADLFNRVAVPEIQKEFERAAQDPFIHFYETFLAEYDPALRETRGVYYTPVPVVRFIVQAVDDILKDEFHLQKGLADYSKINREVPGKNGKPETAAKVPVELHKVQILDPAAGTGTFLAEVIDTIYAHFSNNQGAWIDYCDKHLIPRVNGFEILMASYAMAHFKLDMKLKETGYAFKGGSRLRVYLTNSLESPPKETPELFMEKWLAEEANEANGIKNNTPVMVVLGNPPYSVSSQNKGEWIQGLMDEYKKDLHERNIQPLSDDYIKFIRYGQHFISKNRGGILAYISNNSYLDGLIHRQMRNSLLQCFDKIYILNLHGSSKKKETNIDGSPDINVFDIQQGVSINIFVKNEDARDADRGSFARVFYHDLYGKRETKYNYLLNNAISNISWMEINPSTPYFFFTPKDFSLQVNYEKGFKIDELFPVNSSGVKTHDDTNLVGFLPFSENNQLYNYRPFDIRHINYDLKKVVRHRFQVMQHFIKRQNVGLVFKRGFTENTAPVFITNKIIDIRSWSRPGMQGSDYVAPLYLYPASNDLDAAQRRPNLHSSIIQEIASKTGLSFTAEKQNDENTFAPIDILDYIYAVLYSNNYRRKYREFLKIDFPRIPYPENTEQFQKLASIGSLLRGLHLMENVSPVMGMADFPVPGTNEIETVHYKAEKVYVNKHQYFENIPPEIWGYYIGGYQPAEKWLKDRKGRVLSFEDIEHYQKIITVLKMTIELQAQISSVY